MGARHYSTREDVVFLINGVPVLVIESKNRETLKLFVSQAAFHGHRRQRLFLPGEREHGAAGHSKLEANGGRVFNPPFHGPRGGLENPPSVAGLEPKGGRDLKSGFQEPGG